MRAKTPKGHGYLTRRSEQLILIIHINDCQICYQTNKRNQTQNWLRTRIQHSSFTAVKVLLGNQVEINMSEVKLGADTYIFWLVKVSYRFPKFHRLLSIRSITFSKLVQFNAWHHPYNFIGYYFYFYNDVKYILMIYCSQYKMLIKQFYGHSSPKTKKDFPLWHQREHTIHIRFRMPVFYKYFRKRNYNLVPTWKKFIS